MDECPSLLQPSPKSFQNKVYTAASSLQQIAAKLLMQYHCQKDPKNGSVMLCQVEIWFSPWTRKEAKTVVTFSVVAVQNMVQIVNALNNSLHTTICTTLLCLRKQLSALPSAHTLTNLHVLLPYIYTCLYTCIYAHTCVCSYMRHTCRNTHKEIQSESRFLGC